MDKISVRLRIAYGFFAIILVLGGINVVAGVNLLSLGANVRGIVDKTEVVRWIDNYTEHVTKQAQALRTFAFSGLDEDREAMELSRQAALNSQERVIAVLALADEQDIVAEIAARSAAFTDIFGGIENRLGNSKDALQVVVVGLAELRKSSATLENYLNDRPEADAKRMAVRLPELVSSISQYGVAYVAGNQQSDFDTAIQAAEELDIMISSLSKMLEALPRRERTIARFVRRDGDIVRQSLRQSFATKTGLKQALDQLTLAAQNIDQITSEIERDARTRQLVALDNMTTAVSDAVYSSVYGFLFGGAIAVWLAYLIGSSIAQPLGTITAAFTALAAGNQNAKVSGVSRRDELGALAKAAAVFKDRALELERLAADKITQEIAAVDLDRRRHREKAALIERLREEESESRAAREEVRQIQRLKMADKFEKRVLRVVEAVNAASSKVASASRDMVASSGQAKTLVQSSAEASEKTSANVQAVAGAAEELAVSFIAVGYELEQSAKIAGQAVEQAARTTSTVSGLSDAADQIGSVVEMIKDIAGQTNLLALNATIEAARAGEAGKGFAVVAQEVKNLAAQSDKSAGEIAQYVERIQAVSTDASSAIRHISATIGKMDQVAQSVVAAVEQQSAATQEITFNVQHVSENTHHVSGSIATVGEAADEIQGTSNALRYSAEELTCEANALDHEVRLFLKEIRGDSSKVEISTNTVQPAKPKSLEQLFLKSA